MLKPDGILVTVLPAGFTFRTGKKWKAFNERVESNTNNLVIELPEGTFKEEGTMVKTYLVAIHGEH